MSSNEGIGFARQLRDALADKHRRENRGNGVPVDLKANRKTVWLRKRSGITLGDVRWLETEASKAEYGANSVVTAERGVFTGRLKQVTIWNVPDEGDQ